MAAGLQLEPLAEVVPVERVVPVATSVVGAHLQALFGLTARVTAPVALPPGAHLAGRGQVDASRLLRLLQQDSRPSRLRVGVTASDLCLPILTYVFGEALVGGGVAVVSTARLGELRGGGQDPAVPLERLAKVALHEAAHALGLTHCQRTGCLMQFSAGLDLLDSLHAEFCPGCTRALGVARQRLYNPAPQASR